MQNKNTQQANKESLCFVLKKRTKIDQSWPINNTVICFPTVQKVKATHEGEGFPMR